MSLRVTVGFLARTTRKMKLSLAEEGKTACGTVLVLNMLSCLVEFTWGCKTGSQTHKFGEGERCLGWRCKLGSTKHMCGVMCH